MTLEEKRKKMISFCLTFAGAYEDYPFDEGNWTVMRHTDTKKSFACIFERYGEIWINLKSEPMQAEFLRSVYASVIPAYHMNKIHWNSVILDGSVPEEELYSMIEDSFNLTALKKKK